MKEKIFIQNLRSNSPWVLFFYLLIVPLLTHASPKGGFSGGVSPTRFEIEAEAGDIVRRSIAMYNFGDRPTDFNIKTSEWDLSEEGKLSFADVLKSNSCRPWVHLERHKINIVPSAKIPRQFRFEMHIPDDAIKQECRFAVMLSSLGDPYTTSMNNGSIKLPVTGQIAIIVYLNIGESDSILELESLTVIENDGVWKPVAKIHNSGEAHGRLDGDFSAVDANDNKFSLYISNSPILPGQTRLIPLTADGEYTKEHGDVAYPIHLTGKLYTDQKTFNVDTTLFH